MKAPPSPAVRGAAAATARVEAPRTPSDRDRATGPEQPAREHATAPAAAPVFTASAEHAAPAATRSIPLPAAGTPLPSPPPGHDVAGALLRSAAHLRVDTGGLGSLELHLRVRDGALHLRVDGDAAHLVEARTGELSRALSTEGLRLAPVDAPSRSERSTLQPGSEHPRDERRDSWREAAEARDAPARQRRAAPRAASSSAPPRRPGGHIDVQA